MPIRILPIIEIDSSRMAELNELIAAGDDGTTRHTHGVYGYKLGCRCQRCRSGKREADYRWRNSERSIPPQMHGKNVTYLNYRCRCGRCTEAHRRAKPRKRKSIIEALAEMWINRQG